MQSENGIWRSFENQVGSVSKPDDRLERSRSVLSKPFVTASEFARLLDLVNFLNLDEEKLWLINFLL